MKKNSDRITLRLNPNQKMVLDEMVSVLNTSYSLLIRTIVGAWLSENESYIYNLIDKKKEDAQDKQD